MRIRRRRRREIQRWWSACSPCLLHGDAPVGHQREPHRLELPPLLELGQPDIRVIENKQSTDIGARLTFRVNAHTDERNRLTVLTSVECFFSIGRFRYIASRAER